MTENKIITEIKASIKAVGLLIKKVVAK